MSLPLYLTVLCVETGELIDQLPADADTAWMRSNRTYVHVGNDVPELVTPCGGLGKKVSAYWRGLPGNEVRAQDLYHQGQANARHRVL